MVGVQFVTHFDIYFSGDLAGFPPARAAELVQLGIAVYDTRELASAAPQPTAIDLVGVEEGTGKKGKK